MGGIVPSGYLVTFLTLWLLAESWPGHAVAVEPNTVL